MMMMTEYDDLVTVADIAKQFGVTPDTVRKWRHRFDTFPQPTQKVHSQLNLYRMSELWDWYIVKWPDRVARLGVYLHRFVIDDQGMVDATSSAFGPAPEARGYLKAVRDFQYQDWKIWFTGMGFVAEKGTMTHIWALDPTKEPEKWFLYEKRYKTAGRREK